MKPLAKIMFQIIVLSIIIYEFNLNYDEMHLPGGQLFKAAIYIIIVAIVLILFSKLNERKK